MIALALAISSRYRSRIAAPVTPAGTCHVSSREVSVAIEIETLPSRAVNHVDQSCAAEPLVSSVEIRPVQQLRYEFGGALDMQFPDRVAPVEGENHVARVSRDRRSRLRAAVLVSE